MIDLSVACDSPLRRLDPRTKLLVAVLLCGFAVPLRGLGLHLMLAAVVVCLAWARLLGRSLSLLRRLAPAIVILFLIQVLAKDLDAAAAVTSRILIASLSFCLLIHSTTPEELSVALRRAGMPMRYAHCAVLMIEQGPLILGELGQVRETYRQRFGRPSGGLGWWPRLRGALRMSRRIMAPAIVMSIHRAWAMGEAAYARGYEAEAPSIYSDARLRWSDGLFTLVTIALIVGAWQLR